MGGTGLMFESWKVKNDTQNTSQHHFYYFLKDIWSMKSSCSWKGPTHDNNKTIEKEDDDEEEKEGNAKGGQDLKQFDSEPKVEPMQ